MVKKILIFTILISTITTQNVYSQMGTEEKNSETIYLAGGCFWGTEHFLKLLTGVDHTSVGYANSATENPTYEDVCSGGTGAAEAVMVSFDNSAVSLEKIISLFFQTIDPTMLNQQGNDKGTQYRTGIYTSNSTQLAEVQSIVDKLSTGYDMPLVIEIMPLKNFHDGELYHQDYLDKNPGGYCHIGPELFELAKKN